MNKSFILLTGALMLTGSAFSQKHQEKTNQGIFREYAPNFFMQSILMDNSQVEEAGKEKEMDKIFFMDQSQMDLPNAVDLYKSEWHNPTLSQGKAGSCWCFSTTSMYESEIKRLTGKEVKLSEIHTVYWEYVEKARRFIQERGNSLFDQGSEANAVANIYRKYGAMPQWAYSGLINGKKFHDHSKMFDEMMAFLNSVKANNAWNEEEALSTIQSIMNHYLGEPPAEITFEGNTYTPISYMRDYLKFNPEDYVEILSYKQEPYWQQVEYKVPDNWWHSKEYYNIPLDAFMKSLKKAIRAGYTVSIGGDVSEAGFDRTSQCAMVPSFDIPQEYINEDARQFRFSNESTTDDHGMHLVGYLEKNGQDWYLIKDSSSGSRQNDENANEFGYYFFREDYVKLKMMGFTIHKDAVKDLMKKFK